MNIQSETFALVNVLGRQLIESLRQRECRRGLFCCRSGTKAKTKTKTTTTNKRIVKSQPDNFLPSVILLLILTLAMAMDGRDSEASVPQQFPLLSQDS